jgi:ankyrin repeat protein
MFTIKKTISLILLCSVLHIGAMRPPVAKSKFFLAALDNNVQRLDKFIQLGYDVNAIDGRGNTALEYASKLGHEEAVRLLLGAGADPNRVNEKWNGGTALHECSGYDAAQELIHGGAQVNQQDCIGMTPLMVAGHFERNDVVRALIKAHADLEIRDECGATALLNAAYHGKSEFLRALIKAGADIHFNNDSYGAFHSGTALILAAKRGNLDCLDKLIRSGAELDVQNKKGETALIKAVLFARALKGKVQEGMSLEAIEVNRVVKMVNGMVKLLIDAGANTELKDTKGRTALRIARSMDFPSEALNALKEARKRGNK